MFNISKSSFAKQQKYKPNKLTANIENCGYASVERCLQRMGYKITTDRFYNLLYWCDTNVSLEFPFTLQEWQFVNHFPGTFSISKKIDLARNIERMQKIFPDLYDFHPKSFIVPTQSFDLKMYLNSHGRKTFIIKPDLGSQGRGIFLVQDSDSVNECTEAAIAQEYISPFLIDGLKFDLRIYALVTSVDPLRIYIFDEGMARFCTEPYQNPTSNNLNEIYRHLTNYSVNKHNDHFKQNSQTEGTDSQSHKRAKSLVFKEIASLGYDVAELQNSIDDIIISTLLSVQPFLAHNYKAIFKNIDDKKSRCFEILGFDILIDEDLKPWVLEVNHSPSLSCDSPFDTELKDSVITGALKIVNIDPNFIDKIKKIERHKTLQRLGTPNPSSNLYNSNNNSNINAQITKVNFPNHISSSKSSNIFYNSKINNKNIENLLLNNANSIEFDVEKEYEIARTQTKWRLIYPIKDNNDKPDLSAKKQLFDDVLSKNSSMPLGGMDETAASRQRREAVHAYIQAIEERNSPPKKYHQYPIQSQSQLQVQKDSPNKSPKVIVAKMSPSYNRPTKSVLLLREAQKKKIQEEKKKETMFLFSPEYENYLKMEKSGKIQRAKTPNVQAIQAGKIRGPIAKPL